MVPQRTISQKASNATVFSMRAVAFYMHFIFSLQKRQLISSFLYTYLLAVDRLFRQSELYYASSALYIIKSGCYNKLSVVLCGENHSV